MTSFCLISFQFHKEKNQRKNKLRIFFQEGESLLIGCTCETPQSRVFLAFLLILIISLRVDYDVEKLVRRRRRKLLIYK